MVFQVASGAVAMPMLLFMSISGLGGPLLLALLALRVKQPLSFTVVNVCAALLALLGTAAFVFALLSPLAAVGPLMVLWLSWVGVIPVFVWLTFVERARNAQQFEPKPSNPPVNADARDVPPSAGGSSARAGYWER